MFNLLHASILYDYTVTSTVLLFLEIIYFAFKKCVINHIRIQNIRIFSAYTRSISADSDI